MLPILSETYATAYLGWAVIISIVITHNYVLQLHNGKLYVKLVHILQLLFIVHYDRLINKICSNLPFCSSVIYNSCNEPWRHSFVMWFVLNCCVYIDIVWRSHINIIVMDVKYTSQPISCKKEFCLISSLLYELYSNQNTPGVVAKS